MNHVEDRLVHWPVEFDPSDPFFDPADPTLQGLDAWKRNPDHIVRRDPDRQFDPAALRGEIEQIHAPTMLAGPAKVDIRAQRKALRLAPLAYHGRLLESSSNIEPIVNR